MSLPRKIRNGENEMQTKTINDWLVEMTTSQTSSRHDSIQMQELLKEVGFPLAVVKSGVVFLKGQGGSAIESGTILTINQMSKAILERV